MPHIEIAAEKLFWIFGIPVTNTLLTSWLVVLFLLGIALLIRKNIGLVPSGLQNAGEVIIESGVNLMEGMFGSRQRAEKYLPIVATIFFFVLFSNWIGLLPGIGALGFESFDHGEKVFTPLLRAGSSDLNFTLALAIVAVTAINVIGAGTIGVTKHISKFFSFKHPLNFFVGLLELISEFAKMVSFSFRLFGNIFAGEVLLVIIAFLVPLIVPVPFLLLEIFVGLIQALVFAMLTMVFISIALVEQH